MFYYCLFKCICICVNLSRYRLFLSFTCKSRKACIPTKMFCAEKENLCDVTCKQINIQCVDIFNTVTIHIQRKLSPTDCIKTYGVLTSYRQHLGYPDSSAVPLKCAVLPSLWKKLIKNMSRSWSVVTISMPNRRHVYYILCS